VDPEELRVRYEPLERVDRLRFYGRQCLRTYTLDDFVTMRWPDEWGSRQTPGRAGRGAVLVGPHAGPWPCTKPGEQGIFSDLAARSITRPRVR